MNVRFAGRVRLTDPARALILSPFSGDAILVPAAIGSVLTTRVAWTVADLEDAAATHGLPDLVQRLWRLGLLQDWDGGTPPAAPTVVAILTCDRPAEFRRCLRWILDEVTAAAVPVRIVVWDNASSEAAWRRTAATVRSLARPERAIPIEVFTRRDAETIVATTARTADGDVARAASTALLAPGSDITSAGCGRNALQLVTQGARVICVDDDVCGPVRRTLRTEWTAARSVLECQTVEPLNKEPLAQCRPGEFLIEHLAWLGKQTSGDTIRLTLSGLHGDCATEAPTFEVLKGKPPTGRRVRRGVDAVTLLPVDGLMSYAYGYTNTEPIPPFMPVGRNQDGLFAAMLRTVYPAATACHLPLHVEHAPPGRRDEQEYRHPRTLAARWRANDALMAWIVRQNPFVSAAPSLADLGARLSTTGERISAGDYEELTELHLQWASERMAVLHAWARCGTWLDRRRLAAASGELSRSAGMDVTPRDWATRGLPAFGHYLKDCAGVLRHWEALRMAASPGQPFQDSDSRITEGVVRHGCALPA